MAVFDGVRYSLSPSLSPPRRNELASLLDLNGAVQLPPYTHLVALPASLAHGDATRDNPSLKLVTDRWVDRSVVLGKLQPEQYYSTDPLMIFSGVVACATDLSAPDLEVLSAGVSALGGQWRTGLTRDVTHLFALRPGSDKYNTALHFSSQTHMRILTPHWFDDSVRLGRRVPETPYSWPDPPVLRPGASLDLDDDPLTTEGKQRRRPHGDTEPEVDDLTSVPNEGEQVRVWADRRILLSTSLELGVRSRRAIEAGIRRAGGVVVPIADDADGDMEEKAVDECNVLVTRWRSGKSYFKAARASILIGTLSWLFSVESSGTLHSPLDSLLWYPTPRGGIAGLIDCEISVTNYTGATRDYLKRLIALVGAKFTPSMSQSNKVLVAGFQPSPKTTRALSWSIPVVNHTWLEDCFVEWRALTVGLERYILYPSGVDFGKMLMTRQDEPSTSQSMSLPRLRGGAVPGGRSVGIIDVELEEARDAEYRARDGATSGMSKPLFEDNEPTGSRARADSVKKSSAAKRGSISTPMTASAIGGFVDHVIELPGGDGNVTAQRRTPVNGKQRSRASVLSSGSRARSRSASRASSVGLFSTAMEDVMHPLEGSSKIGKDKGRKGSEGRDGKGKRTMPPYDDAEENEGAPQRPRSPELKPRSVQTAKGTEKRVPARTNKHRQRARNGTTTDSDLDLRSRVDGEELPDVSESPRRAIGVGPMTPIMSGMKPRPRSKSISRPPSMVGGESENEVRRLAAESGTATGIRKGREKLAKPTHDKEMLAKGKKKENENENERRVVEKTTYHPQSPTRSPSPEAKDTRTRKRRLSVVIPSVPKDYFSSQGSRNAMEAGSEGETGEDGAILAPKPKQLAPAASIQAISAEASTSKKKRGKPAKSSTIVAISSRKSEAQPKPKSKKSVASRETVAARANSSSDEDMGETEKDNEASMVVEISVKSTGRGGQKRGAANKATIKLREEVMPDVVSYEKEQKLSKRKRSTDWESTASVRGDAKTEREEGNGKKRKISREEVEEEAEVEEVVSPRSVKVKPRAIGGKGKAKGRTTDGPDEDMDDSLAKNKPSGGRAQGRESVAIRLMTTGVSLTDDVVKRLSKLGVQMTSKPTDCTHLIAKGIVRTEKFLCAMSVSPYILTEEWANTSAKAGKLLPEKDYLLSDAAAEQKWSFKFADALSRAKGPKGGAKLFKSMTFYLTPKIAVDTKLLKNVVSAGGGQVQTTTTPTVRILKGKVNRYVLSCEEDKGIWRPLVQEGFKVYSPELVLRGALRQEIEWEKNVCVVAG